MDPEVAVFGIAYSAYAAEITFTTGDLYLRNPNAIAPQLPRTRHPAGSAVAQPELLETRFI